MKTQRERERESDNSSSSSGDNSHNHKPSFFSRDSQLTWKTQSPRPLAPSDWSQVHPRDSRGCWAPGDSL